MEKARSSTRKSGEVAITPRDILFECPSCGKSLVVDESAQGVIVECPQCHISVIVPPKSPPAALAPAPAPSPATPAKPAPSPPPAAPVPAPAAPVRTAPAPVAPAPAKPRAADKTDGVEISALQERLATLSGQLREVQTQWAEITNRIAARINEVNRELVTMTRLETAQKQILNEWTHLIRQIAEKSQAALSRTPEPSGPAEPPKDGGQTGKP